MNDNELLAYCVEMFQAILDYDPKSEAAVYYMRGVAEGALDALAFYGHRKEASA